MVPLIVALVAPPVAAAPSVPLWTGRSGPSVPSRASAPAGSRSIRHEVPLSDAAGVHLADVDAGAGSLVVRAVPGLDRVQATGTAWATSDTLLAAISLDVTCTGDRVRIRTVIPDASGEEQAGLDLEVLVPAGWSAEVRDGSGEATVEGLAAVALEDGSGSVTIRDVTGPVSVEDGSGDLRIERVAGPVAVEDGSGDVVVRQVTGPVAIDDGSGEVDVAEVQGNVAVSDGSGDIAVVDVRGDLTLADGSGARRVARVTGRMLLPPE